MIDSGIPTSADFASQMPSVTNIRSIHDIEPKSNTAIVSGSDTQVSVKHFIILFRWNSFVDLIRNLLKGFQCLIFD